MKLFVRIRQQTIFSCVYKFIVTSGQLFPVHGELNNTVLKKSVLLCYYVVKCSSLVQSSQ